MRFSRTYTNVSFWSHEELLYTCNAYITLFISDPSVKTFSIASPSPVAFTQGIATSITASFEIENKASGTNDGIVAASSGTNFAFTLQFSDVDMTSGTDTLSLSPVSVTLTTASHATRKLDPSLSFSSGGTASMTVTAAKCAQVCQFY